MTDETTGGLVSAAEKLRKWLPLVLVITSIGGLGWVQAFGTGVQQKVQDVVGVTQMMEADRLLAQAVDENAEAINRNTAAIRGLSIPTDIFEISQRSGPIEGFCVEGQDCPMNIRVRRNLSALSCTIVPGSVTYYYRNPRNNEIYDAAVTAGRARDIGTAFINLPFTFTTPSNLIPSAELCVRPRYTGCPGMSLNDPEVSPDEECFEVLIVSQEEADRRREN